MYLYLGDEVAVPDIVRFNDKVSFCSGRRQCNWNYRPWQVWFDSTHCSLLSIYFEFSQKVEQDPIFFEKLCAKYILHQIAFLCSWRGLLFVVGDLHSMCFMCGQGRSQQRIFK